MCKAANQTGTGKNDKEIISEGRQRMNIGRKISERRKELGLTLETFADQLGVSAQTVSSWEDEQAMPELDRIYAIASILKIGIRSLVGVSKDDYKWTIRDQMFSEDHMFTRIKTIAEVRGLKQTYKALYYIREQHRGQFRKKMKHSDAMLPYIIHPLMMACHAQSMGIDDDETLAVTLLHDVCEDCGVRPDELPFSDRVREAVALLTKCYDKDEPIENSERAYYDAISKNSMAAIVKVIDRCNNVSTMAMSFSDRNLSRYIEETEKYVLPLLTTIKRNVPEYNNAVFLIKYQMLSVLESLKAMLMEK